MTAKLHSLVEEFLHDPTITERRREPVRS